MAQSRDDDRPVLEGFLAWQRVAGQTVDPMYDPASGKDADFDELDPALAEADFARFDEECRLADAAGATTGTQTCCASDSTAQQDPDC